MRSSAFLCCAVAVLLAVTLTGAVKKAPTVNVYTRNPVEFGKSNELICHCSGFHPPRLTMSLKEDNKKIEDCKQSDLSFEQDWTYHIMVHTEFVPKEGVVYACEVTHDEEKPHLHKLEIF
ncbi:beta-2-microglobulin-like [Dendropsophus ebraccatus]|uniref:beta-2-microglobulin-like n=1 Tax=Dendropsophus ebraccatus TaxID=150705 RepID=UPI0038312F9B